MRLALLLLAGLSLYAQAGRTVSLAWTSSVTPNVGYNVYRAAGLCGSQASPAAFTKLNANPVADVTYSDANVAVGNYCYYITATASGIESAPSNNVSGTVAPLPPSGLTVNVSVAVNVQQNGVTLAQKDVIITIPVPGQ